MCSCKLTCIILIFRKKNPSRRYAIIFTIVSVRNKSTERYFNKKLFVIILQIHNMNIHLDYNPPWKQRFICHGCYYLQCFNKYIIFISRHNRSVNQHPANSNTQSEHIWHSNLNYGSPVWACCYYVGKIPLTIDKQRVACFGKQPKSKCILPMETKKVTFIFICILCIEKPN